MPLDYTFYFFDYFLQWTIGAINMKRWGKGLIMHEFLGIAAFPLYNDEILILEEKIYKSSVIERGLEWYSINASFQMKTIKSP